MQLGVIFPQIEIGADPKAVRDFVQAKASNSGSESWTGIGVVAGCCAVVLIVQWPHGRNGKVSLGNELLKIL
jgi:hypothetical protein